MNDDRFGKMFFGRCVTKFRQTMPMTTHIKTKAVVDATITVTDVRVIRLYPNQVPDTEKPKVSKIRKNTHSLKYSFSLKGTYRQRQTLVSRNVIKLQTWSTLGLENCIFQSE